MYEHLLVALDGSPAAEAVLPHAEALAAAFGSKVTLLRATLSPEIVLAQTSAADAVVSELPPSVDPEPLIEADQESASGYLNGVAARLRQRNVQVTVETPEGSATNVIVDRARALSTSPDSHDHPRSRRPWPGGIRQHRRFGHAPCTVPGAARPYRRRRCQVALSASMRRSMSASAA
jgi:nucleotide-binding universal stress UspA family protein